MRKKGQPVAKAAPSRAGRMINTPVHPELVKRVKVYAIENDITIANVLHAILCREFDRMDLIDDIPEPARVTVAVAS